ncbi:hypothetical protein [Arenicella xantha]|uniref:Uncharacterized protein n=1 Tax=Arenicella xantha TaxID=644221 RepID=A0A395JP35_9GAMM|nr:hypothetical protein [Arenicella xantha]RBP51334.1 hypothetical protein DFR28_102754 [Arenicella xantha]
MSEQQFLIMVAGHDYNNHCHRAQKRNGVLAGTTRYEDLCQRRLEAIIRYPKEYGYAGLKMGSKVTAIVLRFTSVDTTLEKTGRQIVRQEFTVSTTTSVPKVTDDSWNAYPGAVNITGMIADDYDWTSDSKSASNCFDRTVAATESIHSSRISVLHLYWVIHQQRLEWVNSSSKPVIFEVSIFSHSYSIGPVLTNTSIREKYKDADSRDPKDLDARSGLDMVSAEKEGQLFSDLVLGAFSSRGWPSTNKYDKVETVFTNHRRLRGTGTVEGDPSLINSSYWQPFSPESTFRIWGCNVAKSYRRVIELWLRSKHKPDYGYDSLKIKQGLSSEKSDLRAYRKLDFSSEFLWKKMNAKSELAALIKSFPNKPVSGKKVTEQDYQKWADSLSSVVGAGILAILTRGIVESIRHELYANASNKEKSAWAKPSDIPMVTLAPEVYRKLKRKSGKLTAYVSAFGIQCVTLDRSQYGLAVAVAFGINVRMAPIGGEGLYQEERVKPKLTGLRAKYPIHEVPIGIKVKGGFNRYRYEFKYARTGAKGKYSEAYGSILEFYRQHLSVDYDEDGYLKISPQQARLLYLGLF